MKEENARSSLFSLLNHPFPEAQGFSSHVKNLALVSLFVAFFLYTLQPFQLDQAEGMQLRLSIYFGLITFSASIAYDFFISRIIRIQRKGPEYTLFKWIKITLGLIVFIGVCNYLFMYSIYDLPLKGILSMVLSTLLIGVFPLVFIGAISMLRKEKEFKGIADEINSTKNEMSKETIEKQAFGISSDQILYFESLQNYVNLYHLMDGKVVKLTQRATLKSCEQMVLDTSLVKCHRSYIVNRAKVVNVAGNAQGLKLSFNGTEEVVPVSRNYISIFKA